MKSGTKVLAEKLLSHIYTSSTLKQVSIALEEMAQNKYLKNHASSIVNDDSLTKTQRRNQLDHLLKSVDNHLVYTFFSDLIGTDQTWIFDREKIDYFDEFVQEFQLNTEDVSIFHITTAVKLNEQQIKSIARELSADFGHKVILNYNVNSSLIGGIQIKIDNYIYDYSLRSKFQQFQREWLASLDKNSKITGRYDTTAEEMR